MTPSLSQEQIESVVNSLPAQNRIMLRLLLIQYLRITQEDIDYMAADQPDSRFLAGEQPAQKTSPTESARDIASRVNQYQGFLHQKRESPALQRDCLQKHMAHTELYISIAERLLFSMFEVEKTTIQDLRKQALSAIPKPAIRRLEQAWDNEEISEEDFQKERLQIEYQTLLRRLERHRRRLLTAQREIQAAGSAPLQNHEIAHIWGIPLGSLAGRKVKALHQYLTGLQSELEKADSPSGENSAPAAAPSRDLWKETLTTLAGRTVARSVVTYDGLEKTEEALMEKLWDFASGTLPEEKEASFWLLITKINDTEHGGLWSSHARSIFALQRLSAIQAEIDDSPETLEEELLARVTPRPKTDELPAPESDIEQPMELNEEALGVLNALIGEQDDKRRT